MNKLQSLAVALVVAAPACAQTTDNPFPRPIEATEGVIVVGAEPFALIPDIVRASGRPMLLVNEPGTSRMFVNDMRGPLYTVTYDGEVALYLDTSDPELGTPIESSGRERGFQSFALHPQFGEAGAPGYGKVYGWIDTEDTAPPPDFTTSRGQGAHDTVLLEWTAVVSGGSTFDGGPARELLRLDQPYGNHNGGHIAFNPLASPGDADFGMLYVGVADGGSGGDPMDLGQDLGSAFGKILRVDPLGSNSANGQYGIPADNPYVASSTPGALGEIFVSGVRNPQRFDWDAANGNLFVADIGQNAIEEISLAWAGADLGWNTWEGSFRFVSRDGVDPADPRSDPNLSFPVAEYSHSDPLIGGRAAATGVVAYREGPVTQLMGRLLFGDFPTGEVFHVSADDLPEGGQEPIRRVLFRDSDGPKRLLELVQDENARRGRDRASRVDLRFGIGPEGRLFLLNKHDGVIREVTP